MNWVLPGVLAGNKLSGVICRTPSVFVYMILVAASLAVLTAPSQAASTFKVVYNFSGGYGGVGPANGLISDSSGNFYGMAYEGQTGYGLVFELSPEGTGWKETVLHNFDWKIDGELPTGILTFDGQGNLYGVTTDGPPGHMGVVFELSPSGGLWVETILWEFNGGIPNSGYISDSEGNLYGNNDFTDELSPQGNGKWQDRTIAQAFAFSAVNLRNGKLYDAGGVGKYDDGMVYELVPMKNGTWQQVDLYDFQGNTNGGEDGADPTAGVVFDQKGNLYGATGSGGIYSQECYVYGNVLGCGTVFKLTPTKQGQWKETVLHRFLKAYDGFGPGNTLTIDKKGNLYGVAVGGDTACQNGCGLIFELSPTKSGKYKYTVVHRFTGAKNDGAWPTTTMIFDKQQKHLYGTTLYGGAYNGGTVFELTP